VVQLSEWLTKLAKKFSELSPSTRKLIAKILLIVAAVGPLLIVLGKLVGAFGMVANAVIGVTKLFAANPWLLLIAAVVALVIVIVKNWDKIKRVILGAWNHIKRATKRVWDGIKRGVGAAVDFLRDLFLNFTPVGQIVKHWGTIKRVILGVWDKLKGAFGSAKEFFSRIWNGVKAVTTTIWNAIGSVIKGVLNVIIRGINAFITGLNAVGAPLRLLGKIPGVPDIPSIPKIPELTRGGLVLETGLAVVHEGETFSGVDGARRQNPGALRLVEGTLRLDENGDAFIRAVIAEENEAEKDHSDSLARMRR
jgi:phage-related minor tail protein